VSQSKVPSPLVVYVGWEPYPCWLWDFLQDPLLGRKTPRSSYNTCFLLHFHPPKSSQMNGEWLFFIRLQWDRTLKIFVQNKTILP
jgi:hypothetical protein